MKEEGDKRPKVKKIFVTLWPVLRHHWPEFVGVFALLLTSTGIEIYNPILVGKSVDTATKPGVVRWALMQLCLLYLGLTIFKFVVDTAQGYFLQVIGQEVTHELRSLLFAKIERLPVPYFDKNPVGRLLTRVINDVKSLSELFTASISVLVLDAMIILGTIGAMLYLHWKLAAVVLMTFPLVIWVIESFGRKLAIAYRSVRTKLSEINAFLGENIGAIATIQRLTAEVPRMEKFVGIIEQHNAAQLQSLHVFAMVQPLTNVLNGVAMGTLIMVGGYWVIQGKITIGILVAFIGYLRNLFQPVRDLVEKYNTFLSAVVSGERVVGLLNEEGEQGTLFGELGGQETKAIVFEKIIFGYPSRPEKALHGVSFELDAGGSLAVVGATGSGKSTLIRLLLRFYEPDSGRIWFGDRELTEWDKTELRSQIGVVHQEIYLMQGTVRENLTLGREGFEEAYLQEQCERSQLWAFIRGRGGLDMEILEGGTNLSLGERQLLSFARVLVFNPPVLILDEATSSVDNLLERRLLVAIREILAGRTSVVIAHRLSTIQECDQIIVLEKGQIIERGTYSSLLALNGRFQQFHKHSIPESIAKTQLR